MVKKEELLKDNSYKEAEKKYRDNKYEDALNIYVKLEKKYKNNKKVLKRIIECLTQNYTYKVKDKNFNTILDKYINKYKNNITKRELTIFNKKYEEYNKLKCIDNSSKFLTIFFLGWFGVHKFIEKKYKLGILYLLTFGLFGFGVIYDLITDYAEYEDDSKLDICRYFISGLFILYGILKLSTSNFYYFVLAGIIMLPIFYKKILKLVPSLIKIIIIIILCCFGIKDKTILDPIPNKMIGYWVTNNDFTNIKSIKIKSDKSTIKFSDRDIEEGINLYDNKTGIITIKTNNKKYYKLILVDKDTLCIYSELNKCNVKFNKK